MAMMEYDEFRAMSTDILMAAEGPIGEIQAGFNQAEDFIRACEKRFTRFSEQSELAAFTGARGGWFDASPDLFEVVEAALRYHERTLGLFDPSILPALEH